MRRVKTFRVSSLSSAAEQRRFAMLLRVVELKEQLEVEEEETDRREEEVEREIIKESAPCG